MSSQLDRLVEEVATDQAAIEGQSKDTRQRVIRMGKRLRQMQKEQKKEQAETGLTWDDWCLEQKRVRDSFPHPGNCRKYMLIARFPGAYKEGMSIKEGYRQAGLWKRNGGNPPLPLKKTIKCRPLITIGAAAGKLERKIETLINKDLAELATEQKWTEDEIIGSTEAVTLLRQTCNLYLRKLNELLHAST